MKTKKQYLVLGLGRFGKSMARELATQGQEVMAVDMDEQAVDEIADVVSQSALLNITNESALATLDPASYDAVIVSIGQNMSASIMVCVMLKEMHVKYLMAKAADQLHARVLQRLGVDRVVLPEIEMGARMARSLCTGNFLDMMELSEDYSIVETVAPAEWSGKTLMEANVRRYWGVTVMGVRRGEEFIADIHADTLIRHGDVLLIMGPVEKIAKLENK